MLTGYEFTSPPVFQFRSERKELKLKHVISFNFTLLNSTRISPFLFCPVSLVEQTFLLNLTRQHHQAKSLHQLGKKSLPVFAKKTNSIVDVRPGSKYASDNKSFRKLRLHLTLTKLL